MQALKRKLKKLKRKKLTGENMDIKKRYKTGELAPDAPKAPNEQWL